MCNFPQYLKMSLIFPIQKAPGPCPKKDITSLHVCYKPSFTVFINNRLTNCIQLIYYFNKSIRSVVGFFFRHMISADTKEERINWCNKINRALANIRTWHSDALRPIKMPPPKKWGKHRFLGAWFLSAIDKYICF